MARKSSEDREIELLLEGYRHAKYETFLKDFLRESLRIEGIIRNPTDAEMKAARKFLALKKITVADMVALVAVIAPDAKLRNVPGRNVVIRRVHEDGTEKITYRAPQGGPQIETGLRLLLNGAASKNPHELHCAYETLHPFTDGNGRSGRLLWLWCRKGVAPLLFLQEFYYETLNAYRG